MDSYVGAANVEELRQVLGDKGYSVGPRTGLDRRTHDEKEWWCFRRLLLTLSSARLMRFPISFRKSESPDFFLRDRSGAEIGVEVTEATSSKWQEQLTTEERALGTAEAGATLVASPNGDGFTEGMVQEQWCSVIVDAITAKAQKIEHGGYQKADRYDFLIYDNSDIVVLAHPKQHAPYLESSLASCLVKWQASCALDRIYIIHGQNLLIFTEDALQILHLVER